MAPCSNYSSVNHVRLSEKDNIKLRKPIVEKMRRDRINSCIEQLKLILEKEFHKQEPNAKLEKADILEMTVSFLRQQLQPGLSQRDYSQRYSPCWRESLQLLSDTQASITPPLEDELHQAQGAGSSSPVSSTLRPTSLQDGSDKDPVWRPW
ncbi:hairy-related 12 [Lampris incognitus]|uniref:hairy-related 12 n=1 Tax=Lampris incognitus TaxID=2546036 RepID=UPI0024B49B7F|nr:hairy-related 12 [Lampris incognitus]